MVIVRLKGGLGNQMFQYAAGRRLACTLRTQLKLDANWFRKCSGGTQRSYQLNAFNIIEQFATTQEIDKLRKMSKNRVQSIIYKIQRSLKPSFPKSMYIEKHVQFDSGILKLKGDVYLEGYWQSERYFKEIEDVIRSDFTLKTEPDQFNQHLAREICDKKSVSIHIRRGDYQTNPHLNKKYGTCNLDYYRKCIEFITKQLNNLCFFVFSDDPEWGKQNLKFDYPTTFISNNDADTAYLDLWLMSRCKHHIISNSTFGWWGAWLSSNPHKIVFAPKAWFADQKRASENPLPDSWTKI